MKTNSKIDVQTLNPSGVFHDVHDIRIDKLEMPKITPAGIIIKVARAGICGTDLHFYRELMIPKGSVLGHEFTGTITEVGKEVTEFKTGTRVVVNPMIAGTGIGVTPGGFANYVLIDQAKEGHNVYTLPDAIDDDQGALIEPISVGRAAVNIAGVSPEHHALIFGAGTIGLVTLASLKQKGLQNIIVSDISEVRLEIAKKLGASETFNPLKDGEITDFIKEKYGTAKSLVWGPDLPNLQLVFECTGIAGIFKQGIENLAPDGKMVVLGTYSEEVNVNPNTILNNRLNIKGSMSYTAKDFKESIDLVASGAIDVSPIITHHFPLSELPRAFEIQADSKVSVKVVIEPN